MNTMDSSSTAGAVNGTAFRAILFALGLGVLVPTTPVWSTGKVHPPNAGGLASRTIPEPFAYCSEATNLPIMCSECPLEPASALGQALARAGTASAVAWRCVDRKVHICEPGASGRACLQSGDDPDQIAAIVQYCRENPGTSVPGAVNYYAAQTWRCDGQRAVPDERYPDAAVDKKGYIAGNWRPVDWEREATRTPFAEKRRVVTGVVYEDPGACPFECCTYGSWRVKEPITIRERRDRSAVALDVIPAGSRVDALTGVVVTTKVGRGEIPADNACLSVWGGRAGLPVEVLHYQGEGYWLVRLGSSTGDCELRPTVSPVTEWWIRVLSPSGVIGWTDDVERFEGESLDACS